MDLVEAKRIAFQTRWLASPPKRDRDAFALAPSVVEAARPAQLVPRVIFREQAVAKPGMFRRTPKLSAPRVNRVILQLMVAIAAVAITGIGLQKVFRDAPSFIENFGSQIAARGAASAQS